MRRGSEPRAAFDERAGFYDGAYDAPGADRHALRARMEVVLRLVGDGPGAVLDAGMGPGRLVAELSERGWEASGVDASSEMVRLARHRLPERAEQLVQGVIESLPFANATFDTVVATGVLEYADLEPALGELARVLRPGGLAVVSYPNPRAVYGIWKSRVYYPLVRSAKRLAGYPGRSLPEGSPLVPPRRFIELLGSFRLAPIDVVPTSYLVVPSPLDELVPALAERLGRNLEARRLAPSRLATQILFSARRAAD